MSNSRVERMRLRAALTRVEALLDDAQDGGSLTIPTAAVAEALHPAADPYDDAEFACHLCGHTLIAPWQHCPGCGANMTDKDSPNHFWADGTCKCW